PVDCARTRRRADAPTRRRADAPTRRHADTPTRRRADAQTRRRADARTPHPRDAMPTTDLATDGYLGPVPARSPVACRRAAQWLRPAGLPAPAGWSKGRAVHERFLYDLATRPALLDRLGELLGEDVVLWGASPVLRKPGQVHPWHSDIE